MRARLGRTPAQPHFFWQGALIILPALVLAGAGTPWGNHRLPLTRPNMTALDKPEQSAGVPRQPRPPLATLDRLEALSSLDDETGCADSDRRG